MRNLIVCLFIFTSIITGAQTYSFNVLGLPFKYKTPVGWKVNQVDTGICVIGDANVIMEMPLDDYGCEGGITISATLVTAKRRAERKDSRNESIADSIFQVNWNVIFGNFKVNAGVLEQSTGPVVKPQNQADKAAYKKRKKEAKANPTHRYSAWYFYSINDSIELLILYQGIIPHSEEKKADDALRFVSENFFVDDSASINTLVNWTDPYQNEAEFLPLRSLVVLNTKLRYPVLPNWNYDTTVTTSEIQTLFLKLNAQSNDPCNVAAITLTYRIVSREKRDLNQESVKLPEIFGKRIPIKPPAPDSLQMKKRDSLFNSREQHYFFSHTYSSDPSESCDGAEKVSETVYIFVYISPTERIRMSISLNYTADEYRTARDFEHAYVRFLTSLIEDNEFELFYIHNKKE